MSLVSSKVAPSTTETVYAVLRAMMQSAVDAANLNPKVIQARLGHATIAEPMDTYGHLFPDAEDLGRGAIDAILGKILAEQGQNWGIK